MTWPVLDESYVGFGNLMAAKTSVCIMIPKHAQRVHLFCETVTSRYKSYPSHRREIFPAHTTFTKENFFSFSVERIFSSSVATIASELSHFSLIFASTDTDNANFFQV